MPRILGKVEASTTLGRYTPLTLHLESSTATRSPPDPIRQVCDAGWPQAAFRTCSFSPETARQRTSTATAGHRESALRMLPHPHTAAAGREHPPVRRVAGIEVVEVDFRNIPRSADRSACEITKMVPCELGGIVEEEDLGAASPRPIRSPFGAYTPRRSCCRWPPTP